MDEECRNCPALCETRTQVVHGYGDVSADFCVVVERPSRAADEVGAPLAESQSAGEDERAKSGTGTTLRRILERLALCDVTSSPERPELENVYVTMLTRCRHPERPPTDEEVEACDPFLEAEIRMLNPEILIPVGEAPLAEIGRTYTRTPVADLELPAVHGDRIRGRGFELVPMIEPCEQTDDQTQAWLEAFAALMASDYRQTKGRRER